MKIFDELRDKLAGKSSSGEIENALQTARGQLAAEEKKLGALKADRAEFLITGSKAKLLESGKNIGDGELVIEQLGAMIPRLESALSEVRRREKAEGHAAEISACQREVDVAVKAMEAVFGAGPVEELLRALDLAFRAIGRINSGRTRSRNGGPSFPVSPPPALLSAYEIVLLDLASGRVLWSRQGRTHPEKKPEENKFRVA